MREQDDIIAGYVTALKESTRLGSQVVCHRVLPEAQAHYAPNRRPWPAALRDVLSMQGIDDLYAHQALATDMIRAGRHVVVATPTASGKTYVYNLPVIERFLQDPDARALYLFPLKALAQDQLKTFRRLTAFWPHDARPEAAIYDGDTTPHFRKKIRNSPPTVLMTNPEMLHLSILPYHEQWTTFLASLQYIVVDEVHTYRGVLGSHMAQLFRRLLRICGHYGVSPTFIFCSATVGNPGELCSVLAGLGSETGENGVLYGPQGIASPRSAAKNLAVSSPPGERPPLEVITQSGAPQGKRHILFINPEDSPATAAILLLQSALARGLRTIVYVQSRRMTELISVWASEKSGPFRERISAYRAGFLPEERREIEAKMTSGELLAVITTSALELGIDIGSLDLCILVGYPGTVMSTMQRGGRVGRASQESAVVLVAGEDALDQYFMRHPEDFFDRPAECAVLNPYNPVILKRHLECAAAELALRADRGQDEAWLRAPAARVAMEELEREGLLLREAEGHTVFAARKRPHRHVDLRGTGSTVQIQTEEGAIIGSVDGIRAQREAHPGAVYLHKGGTWVIAELNLSTHTALAVRPGGGRVDYYTRVRGNKETEILEVLDQRQAWGTRVCLGRLRVTERISGYERRSTRGNRLLGISPLDMPPVVFETEGLWFEVPFPVQREVEDNLYHFMGSIHALEHAAIGILPLLVMTDRNDLGGISTPMHAQVGRPCVFIYDGMPGGAGLTRMAFSHADDMFSRTQAIIRDCGCELGCPSCVHSPKCGSGNRPIDKAGALFLLHCLADRGADPALPDLEPFVLTEAAASPVPGPAVPLDAAIVPTGVANRGDTPDESHVTEGERMGTVRGSVAMGTDIPASHAHTSGVFAPGGEADGGLTDGGQTSLPGVRLRGDTPRRYAVLDVETRHSAQEVGGWHRAERMGVSVAVLYDSGTDRFTPYTAEAIPAMLASLADYDLVVGFNIIRFDYRVLSAYTTADLTRLPTLDMLDVVRQRLNYRVSLDNLGAATLGAPKSADGLQALRWWKEGKVDEIARYCEQDVRITRDLYRYGRDQGYVLFSTKSGQKARIPVDWA